MAGSLNHIVGEDGRFKMGSIENLGDAHEALDECFKIILELSGGDSQKINEICRRCHFVPIKVDLRYGGEDAL